MNIGRGEIWVVGQSLLLAATAFAPALNRNPTVLSFVLGAIVLLLGLVLGVAAMLTLGSSFTVFPKPIQEDTLIQTGVYGLARHPIYTATILVLIGWSLIWMSMIGILLTVIYAIYIDRKAKQEENWLAEKYPDYSAYRQRVRKLIPWIY